MAAAIQDEIVEWLRKDGENGAAAWFERYWTGDRGNYTNASAGYSGNNNAQGIESRWRYMKRDVCGTAGQNLCMSLRNFIPALLAYLKSASARHMGKLFKANAELNTKFVGRPSFEPEMWRMAQRLDTRTLSLSHIECNYDFQRAWKKITVEIAAIGEADTPLTEKIRLWYGMGGNMHSIGKMSVSAIIVPTTQLIKSMERRNYILLTDIEEAIKPLRLQYQQLTHKDLDDYFEGETGCMGPGHMLDVMESFHRLTPIHKFGEQHWKCCCTNGFRKMACHRSALFSALWDPEVRVPAGLSEVKIPNRKGKVIQTAFQVDKVMEDVADTGPKPVWQPKIAGWSEPVTPPPAKRGGRGAGAGEKLDNRDSDSDFELGGAKKRARGRPRIHDLHSSSQPVQYPLMSMLASRLT